MQNVKCRITDLKAVAVILVGDDAFIVPYPNKKRERQAKNLKRQQTHYKTGAGSVKNMNEIIKKFSVDGMTCAHCESTIEIELSNTVGIVEVKASYARGEVIVAYDTEIIDIKKINEIIRTLGYIPTEDVTAPKRTGKAVKILGAAVVLVGGFFILSRLGVFNFINVFPTAGEGTALGMLFVIGLLTSVHCVAMCGGINISQCIKKPKTTDGGAEKLTVQKEKSQGIETPVQEEKNESVYAENPQRHGIEASETKGIKPLKNKINAATFRASILYNLGRVISYTAVGFLVGGLGSVLTFSDTGRGIVAIIAGVFMVIMGLNLLGLFPFLRKLAPHMPKFFAKKINRQKAKSRSPLIVGLLNGLMPCGPLQTMQIYALSTGSPFLGALSMFLFSLGTVPLMFFVGALSSVLTAKFTKKLMAASAVLVIIMGMFMFSNGATLSGLSLTGLFGGTGQTFEAVIDAENNLQTVSFDLESARYSAIKVKKGIPVVWIIRADEKNLNGCNGELKIDRLGITKKLVLGENIIEFTPEKSGDIPYRCWMGMRSSKIIVTD
ncbi:MAG: sulfite exporter TauE/SafE family protein [Clostridiales bacterium]|jgi:sulfite exporter TauE/SafE/copper chaperone CopZ|nr:sulfite exporter TauE/SafE family protein [Clostridiales bacterium]